MNKVNILLTLAVTLLLSDRIDAQDFVTYGSYYYTSFHYSNGVITGISNEIYLKKDKGGFGPLIVSATKSGYYNDTVSTGEILKITLEFNTSFWGFNVLSNDYTEIQVNLVSSETTQLFLYRQYPLFVLNPGSSPYWRKFILDTCTSITITKGQPTAVEDPERETLPKSFSLFQNYPNPFNPSTTISYGVPKSANVSLGIYNTLGQEVALLENEQRSPGYYQIQWNATVPSGIYFYRLRAGEYVETKKMILLK